MEQFFVTNLIKNSIDFVPDSDGKITVKVQRDDNDIESHPETILTLFTVEDNGIGINLEKADKLFQKFYQIDTGPTRRHAGTPRSVFNSDSVVSNIRHL
jgi:signal transduction histidine kinase